MVSILGEVLKKSHSRIAALGSIQEPVYILLCGPCTPVEKRNPGSRSPNTFLEIFSMRATCRSPGLAFLVSVPRAGAWKDTKMDPRGGSGMEGGSRRGGRGQRGENGSGWSRTSESSHPGQLLGGEWQGVSTQSKEGSN